MELTTLLIYLAMYLYGFSLMIWAAFLDKHPTRKSRNGAKIGLVILSLTVIYVVYVLLTVGVLR